MRPREKGGVWPEASELGNLYVARYLCADSLQSCPPLCDAMDNIPPDFSVHGALQARILERVAISFSRRLQGEGAAKMLIR